MALISQIITDTIIQEMIIGAQAANMPASFIKNIKLKRISPSHYEIENAWQSEDGKPLAIFFEYGTRDHYIQPKDPDGVLVWPSGGPESGRPKAIYSKRHDNKKGELLFSKGHWVSGLPAYEPMTLGFNRGIKRMRDALESEKELEIGG